jgi:hypothetical protein
MTAVEYLYKIIHNRIHIDKDLSEYLEQAKEMENQQMIAFALFRDNYFETAETLDEFTKSNVNLVKLFKQQ